MLTFETRVEGDVKGMLEELDPKMRRRAIRATLDKTATFMKKELVKIVTDEYNFKSKDVRDAITRVRTSQAELRAKLIVRSRRPSLTYFGAVQGADGVIVNLKRSGPSHYPGAFIAKTATGYTCVFYRKRGWKHKLVKENPKTYHGLPIEAKAGPSVTEIIASSKRSELIEKKAGEFMENLLRKEILKRMPEEPTGGGE